MNATELQTGQKPYVMRAVGDAAETAQTPYAMRAVGDAAETAQTPYVMRAVGDAAETAQTPGMVRQPAIMPGKGDATKIWMGKVTAAPREKGPPHTHLEAETAVYVLQGHVRVLFGDDFEEAVEAGPGDFLFVPAYTPHVEENPYDVEMVAILCRAPDNLVQNL